MADVVRHDHETGVCSRVFISIHPIPTGKGKGSGTPTLVLDRNSTSSPESFINPTCDPDHEISTVRSQAPLTTSGIGSNCSNIGAPHAPNVLLPPTVEQGLADGEEEALCSFPLDLGHATAAGTTEGAEKRKHQRGCPRPFSE